MSKCLHLTFLLATFSYRCLAVLWGPQPGFLSLMQNTTVVTHPGEHPSSVDVDVDIVSRTHVEKGEKPCDPKNPCDDAKYNVVERTHIVQKSSGKCMCPPGEFWHWRIRQCIKQGAWGYECGFFPKEHWHRVCMDGLKCAQVKGNAQQYFHDGAAPASCQYCKKKDKCLTGDERQAKECLAKITVSGEACVSVQVVVHAGGVGATAEATASHTSSNTATATAEETATVSKNTEVEVKKTATDEATATAKEEETVQARGEKDGIVVNIPVDATGEGKATRSATSEVTVKGKGDATASATATSSSDGEGKATRSATEEVTVEGQEGKSDVTTECVSADEAKKIIGMEPGDEVGPVLAAQVVAAADEKAFDLAYEKALAEASANGLGAAKKLAAEFAAAKAADIAKLKAEAAAKEKAAWVAESNASDEAKAAAKKAAEEQATAEAVEEATKDAESRAEAKAERQAKKDAKQAAQEAANDDAERRAIAKASEKAAKKMDEADAIAAEAAKNVAAGAHGAPSEDVEKHDGIH